LTDATIQSAITNCLSESPVDGLCATYGLITSKFGTLPNWDVSRVSDLEEAFKGYDTFNADISKWDTSSVTTMYYMFHSASAFNQDIGGWNTAQVTAIWNVLLRLCVHGGWNTEKVFEIYVSVRFCVQPRYWELEHSKVTDIGGWNTEKVTMFYYAFAFNDIFRSTCTAMLTGPLLRSTKTLGVGTQRK